MFALSYVLHGIVLNDYLRLSLKLHIFLTLSALAYLMIGFILAFIIAHFNKKMHLFRKGVFYGMFVGACVNLISVVFGISFHGGHAELLQYLFDFGWQTAEQGIGGFMAAGVYILVARYERFHSI